MKPLLILLAFCAGTGLARAQDASASAIKAAEDLRAAVEALEQAEAAPDRVAALTQTIAAYEKGLGALRDGLRRAAMREQEIRARFEDKREYLGQLLAVMSTMSRSEGPLLLLHPSGPEGSARSGMVLADVTPALQAEAEGLRAGLTEIASLRALLKNAEDTLEAGLGSVQAARTSLSQAMNERASLPNRYLDDPEELRRLVESADTMEGFATGLTEIEYDIGAPMEDFEAEKGNLHLPALGVLLRAAGEADAAGIRRPGLILATAPAALVTAPWPATIRYRGPLLDYGNVIIVEPSEDYLLVLAGLGTVYGEVGDIVAKGDPLGLMGGAEPTTGEFGAGFVANAQEGGSAGLRETLYMELRLGGKPVDPGSWFIETKGNQG